MVLSNRFIRSAAREGMAADEGGCTPQLIDLMSDLSAGGVGLIKRWKACDRREAACISFSRI